MSLGNLATKCFDLFFKSDYIRWCLVHIILRFFVINSHVINQRTDHFVCNTQCAQFFGGLAFMDVKLLSIVHTRENNQSGQCRK